MARAEDPGEWDTDAANANTPSPIVIDLANEDETPADGNPTSAVASASPSSSDAHHAKSYEISEHLHTPPSI